MEPAENNNEEPAESEDVQEGSAASAEGEKEGSAPRTLGLKGTRSLRKLRDRVELAASELIRLREENTALQERIEQLESMPAGKGGDPGLLLLDTDPETLKRKVEGFIQSIDNYLENKESTD